MQTPFSFPRKRHHYPWQGFPSFPPPPPPFSFASQPSPNHDFSTSSSRVTRKENRNNTPLEHGRRKVPKFDPVTIYYVLLFDISILNNSYGFRYGYRLKRITIVGIKSEKKEEINKRKRKKTNAIRISWYYHFIEMHGVCVLAYLNGTLLRSSKLYASV